jgi:hypothetical protein
MAEAKPRVDVSEVLQSYSRKLLHEYAEGTKALPKLAYDRGPGRERAVREFLEERLPGRYGVGEGIVVDAHGGQSEQCDVVIYDRERMPVLSTEQSLKIWPYEGVYAVVQVKSRLTRTALEEAVSNIAAFKQLKREESAFVGGPGFISNVGKQNHPIGLLIAHEVDSDVMPASPEFRGILSSVPVAAQIDAYCVISGYIGCRGTREEGRGLLLGMVAEASTELFDFDYGEGGLAFFLLFTTAMLNNLQLGNVNLTHYLRLITRQPTDPPAL